MNSKILEMLKDFEKMSKRMFIEENYVDGDINKFIKELQGLKTEVTAENQEYGELIAFPLTRLELIVEVMYTKKITKNIKDFKKLGNYLKEVADELIKIGESK